MFKILFVRDRMIMAGLIVLGILTVTAGFVSGRTMFQYALSTDARYAAIQWIGMVEDQLFQQRVSPSARISGKGVTIVAPKLFGNIRARARKTPAQKLRIARLAQKEFGLLGGVDILLSGWIANVTGYLEANDHVSKIRNFAILEADGRLILRSNGFDPKLLNSFLADTRFQAEFYKTLSMRSSRIIDTFAMPGQLANEFQKGLVVPLLQGDKVARVYVLALDQSSAAALSKVALLTASTMTSLLIVLGFSIPALIAFRRTRERWKAEDKIRFLAMHDPLTGLPNRIYWQKGVELALARAKRRNGLLAVMCVDLDHFKEVNDTFGHKAGDALLMEASERLKDCVRETDIVARLGGDEFAILAEDLDEPSGAIPLARRICQQLSRSFKFEGHDLAISCSVGITLAPSEGVDVEDLLNNADLALYRAKNDGRNTFRFFEPEMDSHIRKRRAIASELRHALRNDELHIHYQPQFDLRSGVLTGYEALARWTHKELGEVPPSNFISIAEENGLIGMLGEWVLNTTCRSACEWPGDTRLTVNISAAQFIAQDLVKLVGESLSESGLAPQRLLLEFNEDVLLRNNDEMHKTLKQLAAMGVHLAIDNFGAGNSSISNLTQLPVSKIKIAQSFIHTMESDQNIGTMVNMIVGLGKSLGITISASGVETEAQAHYLREIGCNEVQGFYYGRPQPDIAEENFISGAAASSQYTSLELETEPVELPCEKEAMPDCELTEVLPSQANMAAPAQTPEAPDGETLPRENIVRLVG